MSRKYPFFTPMLKKTLRHLQLKYIEIYSLNFLNENSEAQKRMSSRRTGIFLRKQI